MFLRNMISLIVSIKTDNIDILIVSDIFGKYQNTTTPTQPPTITRRYS